MDKEMKKIIKTLKMLKGVLKEIEVSKEIPGDLAESLSSKTSILIKELSEDKSSSKRSDIVNEIINRSGITEGSCGSKSYSMKEKEKGYEICDACGYKIKKSKIKSHKKSCNG